MRSLILTNYGLRLALQAPSSHPDLTRLREAIALPADGSELQLDLVRRGLAQTSELSREAVLLRYRRNPLEHLSRVVLEYTTACNFACVHCRNAGIPAVTEQRPPALCSAVDVLVPLGLRRYDFIGGEVTRFGTGWLSVVRHVRRHPSTLVSVLSNGWFLEQRDFTAAGERYRDDRAYLRALADAGVTHLTFSLDGPRSLHDKWRSSPGLYQRILGAFDRVVEARLVPAVSLVVNTPVLTSPAWLVEVARRLYGCARDADAEEPVAWMLRDPMNYVSNFIDLGAGTKLRQGLHEVSSIHDATLRCKNLFRPSPSLRIQATGELSLCPLADCGEGFGSIHSSELVTLLNRMQEAIPYRLHAEGSISDYRRFVDPSVLGARLDHACSLRAAVTMVARRMLERGVGEGDLEQIRAINLEVAARTAPR